MALRLGAYGIVVWLLLLALTGAVVIFLYIIRSPVPVNSPEALKMGGIAGVVSAAVQWLLLFAAYSVNILKVALSSADVLLLFVCLLGLLGCVSPVSAFIAARYLKWKKLANVGLKGQL